jgi:hypothetical protein
MKRRHDELVPASSMGCSEQNANPKPEKLHEAEKAPQREPWSLSIKAIDAEQRSLT